MQGFAGFPGFQGSFVGLEDFRVLGFQGIGLWLFEGWG